MARIRSIHPGIWTDEEFVEMAMAARLLFIGILNECDDQGVFIWKPSQLKMRLLPSDNVDVTELLGEITKAGFIRRYSVNGSSYGAVRHFREFQRPKKPNAVHPVTAEIRCFSGPKADEHNSPPEGNPGGTNGEAVPGEFPQERSTGRGLDPPPSRPPIKSRHPKKQQAPVEFRGGFSATVVADRQRIIDHAETSDARRRSAPVVPIVGRLVSG